MIRRQLDSMEAGWPRSYLHRYRWGVSNLRTLQLDGGPSKAITNFTSDDVFNFAWSNNGLEIALARGSETSDVVLVRNPH
ncbi:MAG: hypothetical protein ACRD3T_07385 [Terriglobia bacterium]